MDKFGVHDWEKNPKNDKIFKTKITFKNITEKSV
jgi:hypothetical protein